MALGHFNEDVNSNNVQEFLVELRLHEVLSEVNEEDKNNRNGTFEHGTNCIDCALGSEVIMNIAEGIELIECNKIVNSDYQGCLTDLNLEL